jgi:hypothetical protein
VSDAAARRREHVLRFWLEDRSLTFLLVVISIDIFIVGPLHELDLAGRVVLGIVFAFILISGIFVVSHSRLLTIGFSAVALATLAVHWIDILEPGLGLRLADTIASLIACTMLAGIVLVQSNREGPITSRRIQGAVVVYLLIGLIFASAYLIILLQVPGSFVQDGQPLDPGHGAAALRTLGYFSFVTLTTVGYGDIHAVHSVARSLVVLEALIGQLFPAVMLARLVSMEIYYRQRRFEREQAALDREAVAREVARVLREQG